MVGDAAALVQVQRWIAALVPNTSRTAADSALAPSQTTSPASIRSITTSVSRSSEAKCV
jgi:hypothetical protein